MPTVLVVDDNPEVLNLASLILENSGYVVMRATNGLEALMIYSSYGTRLDAVVTDIDMPVMNGIELAERIQASDPSAKVVLMTGCLPAENVVPHRFRVVMKPFKPSELLTALAT